MSSPVVVSGQAIGSDVAVANSTDLAALPTQGLALGTTAYNVATGTSFVLTNSTAALVTDQVVAVAGITGQRWIVQTLAFPVATPTSAGLMSAAQAAAITGGLPVAVYTTSQIDATTTADNIAFLPTNSGFFFYGVRFVWYVLSVTGTATTSLIFSTGNDASHQNMISQTAGTLSAANINALTGANVPPVGISGNNFGTFGTILDNSSPIVVKLVQAPAGITAMKIRLVAIGTWLSTTAP